MDKINDYDYTPINFLIYTYSQRADLGVCDLTITHERRSAVDFTMPFMNLGK